MHDRRSPFLTDEKLINLLITRLKYCKFFGKSCSGFSLPNFSFSTFHSHPDTKSFIIIIISILPKKLKHSSTTAHSHNNLFSDKNCFCCLITTSCVSFHICSTILPWYFLPLLTFFLLSYSPGTSGGTRRNPLPPRLCTAGTAREASPESESELIDQENCWTHHSPLSPVYKSCPRLLSWSLFCLPKSLIRCLHLERQ